MPKSIQSLRECLPPVQEVKLSTEPDCYGISRAISSKLHLPFTPRSFANWLHGWMYADLKYIEQFGLISDYIYMVATKEQEAFFKKNGRRAIAVGAPFVYVKDFDNQIVPRKKRSLLIMPPHGLPYTTEKWNEQDYISEIIRLRGEFDLIVACIHPSCVSKGAWIHVLEANGIPWITGASMHDKNALIRMYRIFQYFEYMTTNCIGSHIAYAALSGCKVSIYGKFAEFGKEDVKNDVLYLNFPQVMEHNLQCSTEQNIRKKFPFLFVPPQMAVDASMWASEQLGESNKLAYSKLAAHLGWLPHQQIYQWGRKVYSKLNKEGSKLFS